MDCNICGEIISGTTVKMVYFDPHDDRPVCNRCIKEMHIPVGEYEIEDQNIDRI